MFVGNVEGSGYTRLKLRTCDDEYIPELQVDDALSSDPASSFASLHLHPLFVGNIEESGYTRLKLRTCDNEYIPERQVDDAMFP